MKNSLGAALVSMRKKYWFTCAQCGVQFESVAMSHVTDRYCSKKCRYKKNNANRKKLVDTLT